MSKALVYNTAANQLHQLMFVTCVTQLRCFVTPWLWMG